MAVDFAGRDGLIARVGGRVAPRVLDSKAAYRRLGGAVWVLVIDHALVIGDGQVHPGSPVVGAGRVGAVRGLDP